jgi:hypothetical protein
MCSCGGHYLEGTVRKVHCAQCILKEREFQQLFKSTAFDMGEALPFDIIYLLSEFLSARDLFTACLVSKTWFSLFASDALWDLKYMQEFACHNYLLDPKPLQRLKPSDSGVGSMSRFAFRCKMAVIFDKGSVARTFQRRGDSFKVGFEDLSKVSSFVEAEELTACATCCPIVKYLVPLSRVLEAQTKWERRLLRLPEHVDRTIFKSLHFLKYEIAHCRFEDDDCCSRTISFKFSHGGLEYACNYYDADGEDDVEFPCWALLDVQSERRTSLTLLNFWEDECKSFSFSFDFCTSFCF